MFALSNGHIGLRGNLDEGDPNGLPGTYLNSFFELRPLPYAEAGYGYPESGQTIVNVTNGKLIRLLVDDEPFDLRYGDLIHHERIFDLRAGVLRRVVEWATPAGKRIRLRTTRLVSFTQRAIAAIDWEVEAVDEHPRGRAVRAGHQRGTAEPSRRIPGWRPRSRNRCGPVRHYDSEQRAMLLHKTTASDLSMAAGMDHEIDGPEHAAQRIQCRGELRPADLRHLPARPASGCGSPSTSPTGGRRSGRSRRCTTRSTPRWSRCGTPAGTA